MKTVPTIPFTFRINAAVKTQLEREARLEDRSASHVAQQAIRSYVAAREHAREAIRAAEVEADKGIFISSASMDKWVYSWGSKHERSAPKPDVFPLRD